MLVKVGYLAKMANLQLATNMANIRQSRNKIFNEMAKRLFESGDFDENDDVDQNNEKSPEALLASQMRRQRVPAKKWRIWREIATAILKEMANLPKMAKIR